MTAITVQLTDAKAQALGEKAKRCKTEQLVPAFISSLVEQADPDFDQAARRILSKNQKLYRRLV